MPQKKSKRIFIYILLFLIIGSLNNKNLNNIDFSKISKVNVLGLSNDDNFKLENNLMSLKINNLFLLNDLKVEEVINSNNLVEEYSVFKEYPSTLNVKILKTKFLAKIKWDKKDFFLGSNGKLTKATSKKKNIPFIFGDFKNKNFFELKMIIDESNLDYSDIRNLFYFQTGRWDIETNSGLLIKLPKENLRGSLKFVTQILSEDNKNQIVEIDLRQKNQIILNEQ